MGVNIRVEDVTVNRNERKILGVDSLEIRRGEVWGLIGPNGAGKSTLLQVLALLEKPNTGKIYFDNQIVIFSQVLSWRRQLAVVFQESLLLDTSVFNNVALGLSFRRFSRHVIKEKVRYWLKMLQIEHLASRPAWRLSGGEAQRVSLARALALEPKVLFLDEPFASLDPPTRVALLEELKRILSNMGITAVFVTHDFTELAFLADYVAAMQGGEIVQKGSPEEVLWRPNSLELAVFLGISNLLPGTASLNGDGTAQVKLQHDVTIHSKTAAGGSVMVCLRPEEIVIQEISEKEEGKHNQLNGRIQQVVPQGGHYRIKIDCGVPIVAFAGASQVRKSVLYPGREVVVFFSPEAVHLIKT